MSNIELNAKAVAYFDLMEQIEALTAEAENIKDALKSVMVERGAEVLDGDGWRATWHNTVQSRFDSRRFKAEHADLYAAFTTKTTGTRFALNEVKA